MIRSPRQPDREPYSNVRRGKSTVWALHKTGESNGTFSHNSLPSYRAANRSARRCFSLGEPTQGYFPRVIDLACGELRNATNRTAALGHRRGAAVCCCRSADCLHGVHRCDGSGPGLPPRGRRLHNQHFTGNWPLRDYPRKRPRKTHPTQPSYAQRASRVRCCKTLCPALLLFMALP